LNFPGKLSTKESNIKFHKNPFSWSQVVPSGQTDRQEEADSRFSQFCEHPSKSLRDNVPLSDSFLSCGGTAQIGPRPPYCWGF